MIDWPNPENLECVEVATGRVVEFEPDPGNWPDKDGHYNVFIDKRSRFFTSDGLRCFAPYSWEIRNKAPALSPSLAAELLALPDDQLRARLQAMVPETVTYETVWDQAKDNHARYSATGDREHDIRFFALGLTGEAGEVANFVKKRWRDGDGHDDDLRKECADVFAYTIMLADALGMSPQDLIDTVAHKQQVFIAKMTARKEPTA